MTSNRASAKNLILRATINVIEREGIGSVTTRKVAKEANVNIAAINYYFGSKKELLRKILAQTVHHFLSDTETILANKSLSRHSVLVIFLTYILRGTLQYPNVLKALLIENSYLSIDRKEFQDQINTLIIKAAQSLINTAKDNDPKKAAAVVMQMVNTVLASGITSSIQQEWFGVDLGKKEDEQYYIESLVDRYVPNPKNGFTDQEQKQIDSILEQLFNSPDSMWDL